ncbi:MAG: hypothetical protein AAF587_21100, partial [Bacteroidota bacterium]
MIRYLLLLSVGLVLIPSFCMGQFNLVGSAQGNPLLPNCYILTPAQNGQAGAIWNTTPLDLTNPFDFFFEVNVGCNNGGADGMTFTLQSNNNTTTIGNNGGSLAYSGINPSVAVEFDTWQNATDPFQDHVAIISNGSVNHAAATNLAGPVSMLVSGANAEDCQLHDVRISWDPAVDSMKVYFDCALRLQYSGGLITNIFNGNPIVFWGFTAATGGANNAHIVCINSSTIQGGQIQDTTICLGDSAQLVAAAGVSYSWNPAAAFDNPTIQNPKVGPSSNATYTVSITDDCGFVTVDTVQVQIDSANMVVDLGADFAICPGEDTVISPQLPGFQYVWQNGSTNSSFLVTAPGVYWVDVIGPCSMSRDSVVVSLDTPPVASFSLTPSVCMFDIATATFTGIADPGDTFTWNFGSATVLTGGGSGPYQLAWSSPGLKTVTLQVEGATCASSLFTQTTMVNPTPTANFIATPQLCANEQAQLTYTGSGSATATYNWDLDGGLPALSGSGPHLVSWNIPGTKTITLTVEENGCLSPPVSQMVDVFPLPDASFFAQPSLCEGDIAQITYTGNSPSSSSYAWTFGGGTVLSGGGQGPYQVQWP